MDRIRRNTFSKLGWIYSMKINRFFILLMIAVLGWMLVIFMLSAQTSDTSNNGSKAIVKVILGITGHDADKMSVQEFESANFIFRKLCHSGVYCILAILLVLSAIRLGLKKVSAILLTFCICALYSVSDEVHQLQVTGRTFLYTDMLRDCIGAAVGIGIFFIVRAVLFRPRETGAFR
jgi:VanZ family protein